MVSNQILADLVHMSRVLGEPEHDLVILAEGNTSVRTGETFWVKASGKSLKNIGENAFVEVNLGKVLHIFEEPLDDHGVRSALEASRVDPNQTLMPSIETFMHADLLSLPEVNYVCHTHPTVLNSLLVTSDCAALAQTRLFPDEVVLCGPATCLVPYADPGMPLSRAIRNAVRIYIERYEATPKVLWLLNHGLITLGKSSQEALSGTLMAVKAARILWGALCTGRELARLSPEDIARIHNRPDEHYRQKLLWESSRS